eukprot:5524330-Heterocapsa_arctica.AAC.1
MTAAPPTYTAPARWGPSTRGAICRSITIWSRLMPQSLTQRSTMRWQKYRLQEKPIASTVSAGDKLV